MVQRVAGRCIHCDESRGERRVEQCPTCFKLFCEDHVYRMTGRDFCSAHCAQFFFFADPEEEGEDE